MNLEHGNESRKIIHVPSLQYTLDPGGLGEVLYINMLKHQDKTAQIDAITGEEDTYKSLLQRCVRTALRIQSNWVKPDDIVSICSYNHLDVCVPFIATLFLNAKVASLDPTLSLTETAHLLKQTKPKLIFVDLHSMELIEKAIHEIKAETKIVFGETGKYDNYFDYLSPNPKENNFDPCKVKNLKETALIFFSSGTSGLPKGICLSHYTFLNNIANFSKFGFCQDVILAFATFYWVTTALWLSAATIKGSARIIAPCFDQKEIWNVIAKYKPTFMFLTPMQMISINNAESPVGLEMDFLKDILVGGSSIHEKQILKAKQVFPTTRVHQGFGQTEAGGCVFCFKPINAEEIRFLNYKARSVGTGVQGFSYRIVDIITNDVLGPNQQGELRYKTDFQLNGYHKIDSSDIWDDDGWLKTGDIAYYDDDKCFYIVDRIKEMLKFQSYHVSPTFLEGILSTHPAIKTCIVIGIPHEVDGDHPMAIAVLREDYKEVTSDEIEKYVKDRVNDRQKLRGGVRIVNEIFSSPTTKVKRRFIKDMVLQGKI